MLSRVYVNVFISVKKNFSPAAIRVKILNVRDPRDIYITWIFPYIATTL